MSTPSDQPPTGELPEPPASSVQAHARAAAVAGPDGAAAAESSGPDPASKRHPPWGWIAGCIVLLLVVGGLAIWALSLQSDLDEQKDQTAQAQQEANAANAAVSELSVQVDDITQTVNDAGDALAQAGQDAQANAQQAIDHLKGELATLREQLNQAARENGDAEATPTPDESQATATPEDAQPTATPNDAQATATP